MFNIDEVEKLTGAWGGDAGMRNYRDLCDVAAVLLHDQRGVYDVFGRTVWFADIDCDGDVYGIQYGKIDPDEAARWLAAGDLDPCEEDLQEYCRETMPAPGTGSRNRLGFISVMHAEDFLYHCGFMAAQKGIGCDSFERMLTFEGLLGMTPSA